MLRGGDKAELHRKVTTTAKALLLLDFASMQIFRPDRGSVGGSAADSRRWPV